MRARRTSTALLAAGALVAGLTAASAAGLEEGDLETSFAADGIQVTDFGSDSDFVEDMAVQADGKAVLTGGSRVDGEHQASTLRYRFDGSLDTSFGGDGKVQTDIRDGEDIGRAVVVQPDGRIVVAGQSEGAYDVTFLVRYLAGGALDTSFGGGDGIVITDWGTRSAVDAMTIQPDGRLLVTGYVQTGDNEYQIALARYTTKGILDGTFGDGGLVHTAIGAVDTGGMAVAVQSDGRIVVAGYSSDDGSTYYMALARYTSSGNPDGTFGGGDGEVVSPVGSSDQINAISLLPDGKILAAARFYDGDGKGALLRYLVNGELDDSYGIGGAVILPNGVLDFPVDMAVQSNGRVLVTGNGADNPGDFVTMRVNANGTSDGTFGTDGAVVTSLNDTDSPVAVDLRRDGVVLVAGSSITSGLGDYAVVAYVGDRTAPFDGHVIGLPRWSTALRPTVYWTASDDNTGVKVYDVVQRVAKATSATYGSYSLVKTATAFTAGTLPGATGRTSCLSVRGRDWAGNIGAFGTESCVAFPVDDKDLAKTGSWTGLTGKAYYAGTARRSSAKGATLSLASADYRHLALVATKCSGCGTVKVFRGITLLATVKLAAGSTKHRVVIPIQDSGTPLSGTIKIKVTSAGKPVTIDGLGISLA